MSISSKGGEFLKRGVDRLLGNKTDKEENEDENQNPFNENDSAFDYRKPFTPGQVESLEQSIHDNGESDQPESFEYFLTPETSQPYQEAKEVFRENFYGIDETEKAFTLQNGEKLINLTPEQKHAAIQELESFLKDPDVKQFIERLKNYSEHEIHPARWQLRLQVEQFTDGTDFTMENFNEKVSKDMERQGQYKLLNSADKDECWYRDQNQPFYKKHKLNLSWVISTNEVVPDTLNKKQDQQTKVLKSLAQQMGLNFDEQASRSHPTETLLRSFLAIRNGKRILENKWDRSFTKDSDGSFVHVGYCAADGADVDGWYSRNAYPDIGSSFSRRSGQKVT